LPCWILTGQLSPSTITSGRLEWRFHLMKESVCDIITSLILTTQRLSSFIIEEAICIISHNSIS